MLTRFANPLSTMNPLVPLVIPCQDSGQQVGFVVPGDQPMWTKIDDNFPDHPKTFKAGPIAEVLYLHALCYANRHLTDGKMAKGMANEMANGIANRIANMDGIIISANVLVERLLNSGLWEDVGDDIIIHDYHDRNPSSEEVQARKAEVSRLRSEVGKRGADARWQNGKTMAPNPNPNPLIIDNAIDEIEQPEQPPKPSLAERQFAEFWKAYPQRDGTTKGSKAAALTVFQKMAAAERTAALARVGPYSISPDATKDNGRYIPDAVRWLREKRWEVVNDASPTPIRRFVGPTPPDGFSWDKDGKDDWIPLGGDYQTGALPYGTNDASEVARIHRTRWQEYNTRRQQA